MQPIPTFSAKAARRHLLSAYRQRGMTLIEWMVSITIGLILLAGLTALIAQQSRTQAELEKSSRQIENGRYAVELLQEQIQHAGYYGEFSNAGLLPLPVGFPNPCSVAAADLSNALPYPVQGFDAPTVIPTEFSGCPPSFNSANHIPGTDILVIRRVDTTVIPGTGTLKVGQAYLQAGLNAAGLLFEQKLDIAASTSVNTTTFSLRKKNGDVAPLRQYEVHIYFISPCSQPKNNNPNCSGDKSDDGGVSIPTLKRLELTLDGGAPKFKTSALVEGIENMQIDYGFDDVVAVGDGSPDGVYRTNAVSVEKWADVMAVRLNLLARNNERSADYVDTKTYNLGLAGPASTISGGSVTMVLSDNKFKRHVFSQLIRVVNPSSRREQ